MQPRTVPQVSILLPTFDRLEFLPATISSVMAQTLTDWELLIGDDGSAQPTRRYLESLADPRIRVLWLTHSGRPTVTPQRRAGRSPRRVRRFPRFGRRVAAGQT